MSALNKEALRNCWIANAARLHRKGHFAAYSSQQRTDVLKKGYLGRWPPHEAIRIATAVLQQGYAVRMPQFNDNMRDHFGVVGEEVRETLHRILEELTPESYEPPCELRNPPGYPFVFRCEALRREIYFKFQIAGSPKKPQVLFWSCHPPLYGS